MLLIAADLPPILVGADEHPGVHRAAADLASDIARILGRRPEIGVWDGSATRGLIIATDPGLPGWQASAVRLDGDRVRFTGSDRCGTMWAVYRACEELLGVDPLWFWTEHPPARRESLTLHDLPLAAPAVRHRGWFLNDEDLLSEWLPGGGTRELDYPFYRQVIAAQALDRVLEAAVRLRMDLVIPASFVDLANPAEAALVEAAVARGLYVTQHHIEPMGVSHFTLERWAKARGQEVPSYVGDPDTVRACWREYAGRWARFGDQVVWTVGLRGRGDRAVWLIDQRVDPTPEGRGRLISAAMADQAAIVREVAGGRAELITVLWAEMAGLHGGGHLAIPEGTVRVLCDHGPTQVWCRDFALMPRQGASGVYYHAGFWGDGPHLVQGVRPARIAAMLGAALAKGDGAFALLNIANLRETSLQARQCADLWWSGQVADEATVLSDWCREQYGDAAIADLHRALFDAYADQAQGHHGDDLERSLAITGPDPALITVHGAPLLDGASLHKGREVLAVAEALCAGRTPDTVLGRPLDAGVAWFEALVAGAAGRFTTLVQRISAALPSVAAGRREFLRDQLLTQATTMAAISAWSAEACATVRALRAGDRPAAGAAIGRAVAALAGAVAQREDSATGPWAGWYRGDRKMDIPGHLARTRRLLETLR